MKKLILLIIVFVNTQAFARPAFLAAITREYPKAASIGCNLCHGGNGPAHTNLFGRDLLKFPFIQGTPDFLKVLDLDSNNNGISNRDELLAGTNPGVLPKKTLNMFLGQGE